MHSDALLKFEGFFEKSIAKSSYFKNYFIYQVIVYIPCSPWGREVHRAPPITVWDQFILVPGTGDNVISTEEQQIFHYHDQLSEKV